MSRIFTITFNPAIDKSTSAEAIVPDKKLRCRQPFFEPGGGGVNVARALTRLGADVTAVYPAGGHTGSFFNTLLQKENVSYLSIPSRNFTRENFIVLDESSNRQYRFGMPGPELDESEWKSCLDAIEGENDVSYIVMSGSLTPGMSLDVFPLLRILASKKNARLVVDTSGPALKAATEAGAFLFKPNFGELASLAGKSRLSKDEAESIAREFILKGKCELMAVSMGEHGAMLVAADKTYHAIPPEVERKSTVGAGDSSVAGMIYSLSLGHGLQDVIRYGVAAGTSATMNPGTELCRPDDIHDLLEQIK